MKPETLMKKKIGQLKKLLWKDFSLYVKLFHSNDGVYVDCYTCDSVLEIGTSNCQAGHWLPKGGYSYHYFNENNVRPQCYHCNISLSGNTAVFERRLKAEIGEEAVEEIYETRHTVEKRGKIWYVDKIAEYKEKLRRVSYE